jgi:WD40 repeat protein
VIKVWELTRNTERLTIKAHTKGVAAIALAPDGRRLASAGGDRLVWLWDLATGKPLRRFPDLPDQPNDLAFAPDGKTLAVGVGERTAGKTGLVKIWDVESGQEKATLTGFPAAVLKVAYSLDGRVLAAGSNDGTVKRFTASEYQEQPPLGRQDPLWSLAFPADGTTLIAGYYAGTPTFWDLGTGANRVTMKAHDGPIRAIAVPADGRSLASVSMDKTAKLWQLSNP